MSKNYGETLAYWYLRLNGFFPLTNFVMHKTEQLSDNTDCDILAMRLPGTYEEVGGQANDWDIERLGRCCGYNLDTEVIGLIVSVKAGKTTSRKRILADGSIERVITTFDRAEIAYGLGRLGIFSQQEIDAHDIVERLFSEDKFLLENRCIGKLLISETRRRRDPIHPHGNITMSEVVKFIQDRFRTYADPKYGARFFFPDELIQFMAWQAKHVPLARQDRF